MKSTKFHCFVMMTKYIFKTMDMMDQLLDIRVNYKKNYVNSIQKSFFFKHVVLIFSLVRTAFLSSILNLKNTKNLKKYISEELMPVAWYHNRWWNLCVPEEKKQNQFLLSNDFNLYNLRAFCDHFDAVQKFL